jgi:hypothetical protein
MAKASDLGANLLAREKPMLDHRTKANNAQIAAL